MKIYAILSLFLLNLIFAQPPLYKNLALEGGGVRGIAYCGALEVLENAGIITNIERIGGTSAGAIAGALLAVGYSAKEMQDILGSLQIQAFNDAGMIHTWQFAKHYGFFKGDKFEAWMGKLIGAKLGNENLSFADLHQLTKQHKAKDLFVTATNLTTQKGEIFSHLSTPKMPIKTAIRISMSVPLYYQAVLMDDNGKIVKRAKKNQAYQVYIDGGLYNNYPLNIFDHRYFQDTTGSLTDTFYNNQTLGLKLERPEQLAYQQTTGELAPYPIHHLKDYIGATYNFLLENAARKMPISQEKPRTIYISTESVGPRVKKMSLSTKLLLVNSGKKAALEFLRE